MLMLECRRIIYGFMITYKLSPNIFPRCLHSVNSKEACTGNMELHNNDIFRAMIFFFLKRIQNSFPAEIKQKKKNPFNWEL